MAAVLDEKPDPAAKFATQVDEQIAQATSRIRVHDVTLGVLTLAAMLAVYATVMILLDRYLTLAEGVRQLALGGYLLLWVAVGYLLVARPLLKRINPLYAAARVEDTIDDAKNSVTGYVEAQENGNVHAAVKAAMSAKAARAVGEADVNQAVNHRSLLVAGGVLVVFLLALGVLFFVFRPTQFNSLVGRAFLPFTASPIATRTQLTLVKPERPSPTITTGQTITVAVHVGGKVPARTDADRVRVLLRHNPADPNYEEVPMVEGETRRDWSAKIPEYLVQNGFWYKVAGGDAETPEYKVTVRSLPLFTDFEANYEYPKYTRKPNDRATDPNLRGVRGTKVTLFARTNRQVKDGVMKFEAAGLPPVAAKLVEGKPDSLAFHFTITEPTRYRLTMTTTDGEQNSDAPPYHVALDSDQPPRVEVTRPEEPEITAPANGQLAVDGTVGDDFGIDKVRLRMRVAGRDLAPVFYNGGKSLRREKDYTWPTDLSASGGFKLSADLTKVQYADGSRYEPKENDVVEFWVEAIDNCTETKPVEGWGEKPQPGNVGSSQPVYKLRLTAPKTAEEEKTQLQQDKDARLNEEKQHAEGQQKQLDNENREPPKPDANKQLQNPEPQKNSEPDKKGGEGQPEQKTDTEQPKGGKDNKDGKQDPKVGKDTNDGKQDPKVGKDPMSGQDPKAGKQDSKGGQDGQEGKQDPKGGKADPKDGKKSGEGASGAGGMKVDPPAKQDGTPKKGAPSGKGSSDGSADPKADPNMMPPGGKPPESKTGDAKSSDMAPKGGMPNPGMGGDTGSQPKEPAPAPRSEEDRQLDEKVKQAQEELDKMRGEGGDAKLNPTPKPEDRTDPAKAKPKAGDGQDSPPKEGPKPDPKSGMPDMAGENRAGDSKPQGNLEKPKDPNPESKPGPQGDMQDPQRGEPLGGSAGKNKESPTPKKDMNQSDGQQLRQDPASGAAGKPASEKKDAAGPNEQPKDPTASAGAPKPNNDPDRGMDKNPQPQGAAARENQPKTDPTAAAAKPDKAPPGGERKPMPKDDGMAGKQPDASATKEPPANMTDPMNPAGGAAEAKPDAAKPMGGAGDEKRVDKGIDKTQQKDQAQAGGQVDPKNKKEPGQGDKAENAKLDEKQLQAAKDAAKDLNDPDPAKQAAAREKLDNMVGKANREAIEDFQKNQKQDLDQLAKDLQSKDEGTRKAAEKKLDDLRKQADEMARKDTPGKDSTGKEGNGRELSEAEVKELTDKARDLASDDPNKRREAEQKFDEKLGKEAREQIQQEVEKRKMDFDTPPDPEKLRELQEKLKEQARKNPKGDGGPVAKAGGGADSAQPKPADEADPRNKAKAAQLQLEEFERQRNTIPEKLKWTDQETKDFYEKLRDRVRKLEQDAEKFEDAKRAEQSAPTIASGGAEKVGERENVGGSGGVKPGASFAPPGFGDARSKFLEAAKKLDPNK